MAQSAAHLKVAAAVYAIGLPHPGNRYIKYAAERSRDCICFTPDEPPYLQLKAEIEAAKAVRCPLHGERFSKLAPRIYCSPDFITPVHLQPENWFAWHSPQYRKALKASFPPDRWPAREVAEPEWIVLE